MIRTLLFSLLAMPLLAVAQGKAKISITRESDGTKTTEVREVEIQEGQDINMLLEEMGILDEFGQLRPGQQFEINIEKSGTQEQERNVQLFMRPNEMPVPPMAPYAQDPGSSHAYLGVMLKDATNGKGALITEVVKNSPAEKAGFEMGDIITRMESEEIENAEDVVEFVQSGDVGDDVKVTVLRDGKKKRMNAELGKRDDDFARSFYGVPLPGAPEGFPNRDFNFRILPDSITVIRPDGRTLQCDSFKICQPFSWNNEGFKLANTAFLGVTPSEEPTEMGVIIGSVVEGSAAETMGLQAGDAILSVNNTPVNSFDELSAEIRKAEPGSDVIIVALRNGREKTFTGKLGERSTSARDDFRIFHDFKGMDEEGQLRYDYEFDMDEEDIENQMQDLLRLFEEQQSKLNEERSRVEENLNRLRENKTSMQITIEVSDITPEEAARVNESASPRLSTSNDLIPDRIVFFPNPSDGVLNLSFTTHDQGDLNVIVYDSKGVKVYFETLTNFTGEYANTIEFTDQPDGAYYLQLTQNGKSFSRKLIKGK